MSAVLPQTGYGRPFSKVCPCWSSTNAAGVSGSVPR